MAKSRAFSIYLLKDGFDAKSALKAENSLDGEFKAKSLPEGAVLYILDAPPTTPWWKGYFDISGSLSQASKGALVVIPIENRWFALSFGHVYHNLLDTSYEHDFGLRVTLNSLDPERLRSTDALEPGASRRRRTQLPTESELTLFDFDRDSTILKSLTGKVKDDYKNLFRHATGASNLRISSSLTPKELTGLCEKLLTLYKSEDYKTAFPDIQNILPVSEPHIITTLNAYLIAAIKTKDDKIGLAIPDLINYNDNMYAKFSGRGPCEVFSDIFIGKYYDYLENSAKGLNSIDIPELKKHQLLLTDEIGQVKDSHTIFKSLLFDTQIAGSETYYLCDGQWFKIENSYIEKLDNYLNPLWIDLDLPSYDHKNEAEYNKAVAAGSTEYICLDMKNIAPIGTSAVEPCDIYGCHNETATFFHVKISTLSAKLSHLFNQGVNSVELLKMDDTSLTKLKHLIAGAASTATLPNFLKPIESANFKVVFAIVTHKAKDNKADNLPLFSKISLMRAMKSLKLMSVTGRFGYIKDDTNKS